MKAKEDKAVQSIPAASLLSDKNRKKKLEIEH